MTSFDELGGFTPELHPALVGLASFVGTWRGAGHGDYPTIEPFDYVEEVVFGHVGKAFLSYQQRTKNAVDGTPMHAESGYVRPVQGRVEWVVAQPTGIVEACEGTLDGQALDVASTIVALTGSAKRVQSTRRRYEVDGDVLTYDVWMAHGDQPVTHHLHAVLERVPPQ